MGRKSTYTEEIGEKICERLAAGESLLQICKDERMPAESTVRLWASQEEKNNAFPAKYARARELGYARLADEILAIADDASNDFMERETERGSVTVVDQEVVQRSRLRVDTRKWLLYKMLPKVYGDRTDIDVKVVEPVRVIVRSVLDPKPEL